MRWTRRWPKPYCARDRAGWFGLIGSSTKRRQFERRLRAARHSRQRLGRHGLPDRHAGHRQQGAGGHRRIAVAAQLLKVWQAQAQARTSAERAPQHRKKQQA